jgi:hypothetical protein
MSRVIAVEDSAEIVIATSGTYRGYLGVINDCDGPVVPYTLLQFPASLVEDGSSGLSLPQGETIQLPPFGPQITFSVSVQEGLLRIQDKAIPLIINPSLPVRVVVVPIESTGKSVLSVSFAPGQRFVTEVDAKPVLVSTPNESPAFPQWSPLPVLQVATCLLNNLNDLPPFEALMHPTNPANSIFPALPFVLRSQDAEVTSPDLKEWALARASAKLFSGWATVIILRLVFHGHISLCSDEALIRLFSLLVVALEPCDRDRLKDRSFPFSLERSILAEGALCNALNFGLEREAMEVVRIISQMPNFTEIFRRHITALNRTASVHLLTDPSLSVAFFAALGTKVP